MNFFTESLVFHERNSTGAHIESRWWKWVQSWREHRMIVVQTACRAGRGWRRCDSWPAPAGWDGLAEDDPSSAASLDFSAVAPPLLRNYKGSVVLNCPGGPVENTGLPCGLQTTGHNQCGHIWLKWNPWRKNTLMTIMKFNFRCDGRLSNILTLALMKDEIWNISRTKKAFS